jgi:SAM-dependent methyltransferase
MAPTGARVAELGCGAGWLCIMLAKLGASDVVGIDFSPEQIGRARRYAQESGVDKRVRFEVGNIEEISERVGKCHLIVAHAFLHHLATTEIRKVLAKIHRCLTPRGHLIIWEPVQYPRSLARNSSEMWKRVLWWLTSVPNRGQRWGIRKQSEEELNIRRILAGRQVGNPPQGPSPKETPFSPGEIEMLVDPLFDVVSSHRCMAGSLRVAEELLLMGLSHPYISRALFWPLLWTARLVEIQVLKHDAPSDDWVFEMFDCVAKEKTTAPISVPASTMN